MYRKTKTPKIQKTHWTSVSGGSIGYTRGDGYVAVTDAGQTVAFVQSFHAAQEALNAYLTTQARQEAERQMQIRIVAENMAILERSDEIIAAYAEFTRFANSPSVQSEIIAAYAALVKIDTHTAAHRVCRWQLAHINANGGAW